MEVNQVVGHRRQEIRHGLFDLYSASIDISTWVVVLSSIFSEFLSTQRLIWCFIYLELRKCRHLDRAKIAPYRDTRGIPLRPRLFGVTIDVYDILDRLLGTK
jgi:hypothetical protein